MTGPEHYRAAERLLAEGEKVVRELRAAKGDEARRDALGKQAAGIWQQAQAHAALAQVAATLNTASAPDYPMAEPPSAYESDDLTWRDVLA